MSITCLSRPFELGKAPYKYLTAHKKEKTLVASLCKTSAAIALLVPGILLFFGCWLINAALSPCSPKKIQNLKVQRVEKNLRLSPNPQINSQRDFYEIFFQETLKLAEEIRQFSFYERLLIEFLAEKGLEDPRQLDLDFRLFAEKVKQAMQRKILADAKSLNGASENHFQDIANRTDEFLEQYQKIVSDLPPDLHGNFCKAALQIWIHVQEIGSWIDCKELELLAKQKLSCWRKVFALRSST